MTRPRLTSHRDLMRDPRGVAHRLVQSGATHGVVSIDVRLASPEWCCLWVTLDPWAGPAAEGYPREQVAITVFSGGRVVAVPVGAFRRTWLHRNPDVHGNIRHLGELCLWYPGDPPALRWDWTRGFEAYLLIVHRHLQAEEFARRNGYWPAEDAPHGEGAHPIRTAALRAIVEEAA